MKWQSEANADEGFEAQFRAGAIVVGSHLFVSLLANFYLSHAYLKLVNLQRLGSISFAENEAFAPLFAVVLGLAMTVLSTVVVVLWCLRWKAMSFGICILGYLAGCLLHVSGSNGNDYESLVLWLGSSTVLVLISALWFQVTESSRRADRPSR